MFKKNFFIKKAAALLYTKGYNRNNYNETPTYTKKKEGLISYLTVDTYQALYKTADIQHSSRRRWIKRKKKRSLSELKALQKPTLVRHAHSLLLNNTQAALYFQIQQRLQLKTFLPFVQVTRFNYLLNLKNSLIQFKTLHANFRLRPKQARWIKGKKKIPKRTCKQILNSWSPIKSELKRFNFTKTTRRQNFYVLKPLKGGFKAYTANALGFLPKVQIKKICKQWLKNWKKKPKNVLCTSRVTSILPKPLNIKNFKNFKVDIQFKASYKKKNFSATKTKRARSRIRSNIKFIFKFFKQKPFWQTKSFKQKNKR